MKLKSDLIDMWSKESGRVLHIGVDRADFNHLGGFQPPCEGLDRLTRPDYAARLSKVLPDWVISLTDEWLWAAVICAAPFALFGALEAVAAHRRKRAEGIARRSKSRSQGSRS
jgi:hypothetical protein